MRPQPRSTIASITWRVTLKTLSRLVEITARHWSGVILRNVESRVMPAQFTRMSTGPCSASIFFTISPMASKSVTSPKASAALAIEARAVHRLAPLRFAAGNRVVRDRHVAVAREALADRGADAADTARHEGDSFHCHRPVSAMRQKKPQV